MTEVQQKQGRRINMIGRARSRVYIVWSGVCCRHQSRLWTVAHRSHRGRAFRRHGSAYYAFAMAHLYGELAGLTEIAAST